MRQLVTTYVLFLVLIQPGKTAAGSYPEKTINKALKLSGKVINAHLEEKTEIFGLETIPLDSGMKHFSFYDTLFSLQDGNHEQKGYLVISSARGRYERFDYSAIYSMDRRLVEIRILTYRSDHGSQVTSKGWLRKFTIIDPAKEIEYGVDIDALSGATFSAKSLTTEISRLNKLILEIE